MRLAAALLVSIVALTSVARAATGVYDARAVLNQVEEGRASKARLKSSWDRRQREIDARKADFEKRQKELEATADAGARVLMEGDLAARRDALVAFFKQNQAELEAEEQAAIAPIRARIQVVAEELRAARGLEKIVEKPAKGKPSVSGEDVTAEMVRAYDAKHPVTPEPYGPLVVQTAGGGDLYVAQDGALVPHVQRDGVLVFQLANRPFEIGTGSHQVNLCLTEVPAPELRIDPAGNKASCLSGPMQAAREAGSAELYVYSGKKWSDGNVVLQEGAHRAATPLPGWSRAYQVTSLVFVDHEGAGLATFRGTLHGWVAVYHGSERRNRDIMPIQLVFAGSAR